MSIIKNVSGPYTINTINHSDPITLDSNVVIINGNLQVFGNTLLGQTVAANIQQTYVTDNIIVLNAGWAPTDAPTLPAGIEINRGSQPNVYLRWNENTDQWQVVDPSGLESNLVATSTGLTKLNEDPAPQLSANLNVGPNWITSNSNVSLAAEGVSNQYIKVNSNLALQIYPSAPAVTTGRNTVHGGNVAAGGTGVYVTTGDGAVVGEELISKKRAIVYSIIF
jgi:hypothetical protein